MDVTVRLRLRPSGSGRFIPLVMKTAEGVDFGRASKEAVDGPLRSRRKVVARDSHLGGNADRSAPRVVTNRSTADGTAVDRAVP
jgi:hypothetical protein